jgi:2-phospho-L-lactate guanylyltransferase
VNPRESASHVWTIIPVKPLRRAKSRLARALKADQRAALARSVFARTLDVLASVDRIEQTLVVSSDLTVHDIARAKGALTLAETEPGLNVALSQACAFASSRGASGVLIVPTDLPLLTAHDVESLIDLAGEPACLVIAPDRHDEGTNALLLRPPHVIQPAFGPSSFEVHQARATALGISVHIYRSPTLSLDIDRPSDLQHFRELAPLLDAPPVYE